jgi:hypothetical protein
MVICEQKILYYIIKVFLMPNGKQKYKIQRVKEMRLLSEAFSQTDFSFLKHPSYQTQPAYHQSNPQQSNTEDWEMMWDQLGPMHVKNPVFFILVIILIICLVDLLF